MRKWNRTASSLFLAAASVYAGGAIGGIGTPWANAASQPGRAGETVQALKDQPAAAATTNEAAAAQDPNNGTSVTSDQVNVGPAGTVEIHVNNAKLVEVLRMLSLQSQRNILATPGVGGTVTANLYDVTVPQALNAILTANGYGYIEKDNIIYVYPEKTLEAMKKAQHKVETKVFRLYYVPAADAQTLIKPALSSEGKVQVTVAAKSGLSSSATEAGGDSHSGGDMLVVSDYPENLKKVEDLVKQIDHRPEQVLVEATMLAVKLDETNELGVNFTALGGVDFSSLANVGSAGTGSGLSQALGGGITENSAANSVNSNGFIAGQMGGNGLQIGSVINGNVGVFIKALENVSNTTILANPKVLVLNKQMGNVHVGSEDGYRGTSIQTETTVTSNIQTLDTGIRLLFRPFIGDDGWIRMEVHPEDSSGSVDATSGLPSKTTTEVTTNIMVKDGHTIVIGGLFRETGTISKGQVPLLGNLPFVGPLFRDQTDTTHRQEIIILLTPHIIKNENAYANASRKLLDDAEKLRVGVRREMMPWGRERLAESAYEKAVAEMNKANPDRKKAIWYLDSATNLNPTFLEAINLKQTLTGQEVTAVDNSAIRDFVRRRMMDQTHPPATRPTTLGMTPEELPERTAMVD